MNSRRWLGHIINYPLRQLGLTLVPLRHLAQRLRGRWHAPLCSRLAAQSDLLTDISRKLDAVSQNLDRLTLEATAARSERGEGRAVMESAVIGAVEQLLSRRLAEQTRDLQAHLQLHAASIVAQVGESAAAHADVDAANVPFSRAPTSARAA